MGQYSWVNCPDVIREQVENFRDGVIHILGDNLTGIYLHGSLAMGCFNPARSDLDVLVITRAELGDSARAIAELTLNISDNPSPLEVSCLREAYLQHWQYPTPFDFHFSEGWREKTAQAIQNEPFGLWAGNPPPTDPDLAAHITITRTRGICLTGKPITEVFPEIPRADYLNSILDDVDYARERINANPVYAVLNFCRVYSYLREGRIHSKDEAGVWALDSLPEYRALIQVALDLYRSEDAPGDFDPVLLAQFADDMQARIKQACAELPDTLF